MKKLLLIPITSTILSPLALSSCTVYIGNPPPREYTINFNTGNILEIEDLHNEVGEDYVGLISLKKGNEGTYDVPQTKCYYDVIVNGQSITDFDVDQVNVENDENYQAKIIIPTKYFGDHYTISINAKPCPHYLCFEANSDDTIIQYEALLGVPDADIEICTDISVKEPVWTDWHVTDAADPSEPIELDAGQKIYVRNTTNTLNGIFHYVYFLSPKEDKTIKVSGNIMSLLNFGPLHDECFINLFSGFNIADMVPIFPSMSLKTACYGSTFDDCDCLNVAPELPATQLAKNCYREMFKSCEILAEAPELPARELQTDCYTLMFHFCSKLTISEESSDNNHLIFDCPHYSESVENPVHDMFGHTAGRGEEEYTPEMGKSYYWVETK